MCVSQKVRVNTMNRNLQELERTICYQFKEHGLFVQALTHSSYANEHRWNHSRCNERLEFLGDAVLEIVTSDFLYHKYEDLPEGDLTKIRASIVCEPTLAYCAGDISLGEYLLLGKGEEMCIRDRAITSLISLIPLVTALKLINSAWVRLAMMLARVVFPTPGGPQKTMEGMLS